jgi:hypothetical protein
LKCGKNEKPTHLPKVFEFSADTVRDPKDHGFKADGRRGFICLRGVHMKRIRYLSKERI